MTQTAHQSRVSGRLGRGRSARSSSHGSPAARRLVAEDATYISLNFENPELKRVLPWIGTSSGPEAFISTFTRVATYWPIEDQRSLRFGRGCGGVRLVHLSLGLPRPTRPVALLHPCQGEGRQDRLLPVHGRHLRHRPVLPFERGMGNPDATRRADFRNWTSARPQRVKAHGQIMSRDILWCGIGRGRRRPNTSQGTPRNNCWISTLRANTCHPRESGSGTGFNCMKSTVFVRKPA